MIGEDPEIVSPLVYYMVEMWTPTRPPEDCEPGMQSWGHDGLSVFGKRDERDALDEVERAPGRVVRVTRCEVVYTGPHS